MQRCLQSGELRPVQFASRSLTSAERGYSQLEKEALAITFALNRFRNYLLGVRFTVHSDHKPLQHIVRKSLDDCPPRILRFLLSIQGFDFDLVFKPGRDMVVADAFSRAPLPECDEAESRRTEAFVHFLVETQPVSLSLIAEHVAKKPELLRALTSKPSRFSDSEAISLAGEKNFLSRVVVDNGYIICKGNRIYIPCSLRKQVLNLAHTGHPGVSKMRELVCSRLWWPGVTKDCDEFLSKCITCKGVAELPQPQPLRAVEFYDIWEYIACDIFHFEGRNFLSIIDYRLRWPEVFELGSRKGDMASNKVISKLAECFARFGIPKCVVSDSGSQFVSSETRKYFESIGTKFKTSCPHHHSENGRVERFHRTIKRRLRATTKGSMHMRLQTVYSRSEIQCPE